MVKRRSPLFMQKQPGGVFDYVNVADYPGDVWFVDSTNTAYGGDAAGYGQNPDHPFLTIDYAVGNCDTSDVILVMPGHAETVSAAGGLDLDVQGITIIGVGNGSLIPTVTLDTDIAADVDIDASDITVQHIRFFAGLADITAAIDVNACNASFIDCQFLGDGTTNALIWIQDAAAGASDYITVKDCFFYDPDASNTHAINLAGTGFGHYIVNNRLMGDWGTAAIGGAGAVVCATIANNYIWNIAAVNDTCIATAADGGWIVGNMVSSPQAQANAITAANIAKFNNYQAVDTEDLSGLLEPIST